MGKSGWVGNCTLVSGWAGHYIWVSLVGLEIAHG